LTCGFGHDVRAASRGRAAFFHLGLQIDKCELKTVNFWNSVPLSSALINAPLQRREEPPPP